MGDCGRGGVGVSLVQLRSVSNLNHTRLRRSGNLRDGLVLVGRYRCFSRLDFVYVFWSRLSSTSLLNAQHSE